MSETTATVSTEVVEVVSSGPQTVDVTGTQVRNSAGGFVFAVDDMRRVHRFLILGSEGGSYYTSEQKLTLENAAAIARLMEAGRGPEVVEAIKDVSVGGRAAKQNQLIFALAMCARLGDEATRRAAYGAIKAVLRIPTHLFQFIDLCESISKGTGWGRIARKSVQSWYNDKDPLRLAMAVTKYRNREGWTHRDILRLCHPKPTSAAHKALYRYIAKDLAAAKATFASEEGAQEPPVSPEDKQTLARLFEFLEAVEEAGRLDPKKDPSALANAQDVGSSSAAAPVAPDAPASERRERRKVQIHPSAEARMCELITRHGLVREHVANSFLNSAAVWKTLLEDMPMTAMLRNLAKMTNVGLLTPSSECTPMVASRLTDRAALRAARVHPFSILLALKTYAKGEGDLGSLTWAPVPEIEDALDEAFHAAFKNVEPTNKRFVLGIDVSGSMHSLRVNGARSISAAEGAAAMAMLTAKTELNYTTMAFSHTFVPLDIRPNMNLNEVLKVTSSVPFGATDCALPITWAMQNDIEADCFIVYTDCETFYGDMHPFEALRAYRAATGIPAKLIVVAMTSNGFSIANPEDRGMLDMVGFDADAPQIIADFVNDKL